MGAQGEGAGALRSVLQSTAMFAGLRGVAASAWPAGLSAGLATPFSALVRHASKKAKGSSKNGRDTIGKRLGPKVMDGEYVSTGNILMRQRGTHAHAGTDVAVGRDYTLYALAPGIARFVRGKPEDRGRQGGRRGKLFIRIDPPEPHREASIARKLARQALARYRGPVLHAPL
jgi:large subunit ribosomal protein L27